MTVADSHQPALEITHKNYTTVLLTRKGGVEPFTRRTLMERENKIWEGEGLLWQKLAIYETSEGMVGVLSNSKSFMKDKEIFFPDRIGMFAEIIAELQKTDADFYDTLTEYGEEG